MAVHPTSLGASVPTTAPGPSRRGHGLPPPTNPSPAPLRPRGLPWTSALGRADPSTWRAPPATPATPATPARCPRPPLQAGAQTPPLPGAPLAAAGLLTPPQETRPLRPLLIAGHVHYRPPCARIQAPQGRELSSVLSPICPQTEDGDPSPQHVCTHTVSSVQITFPRPPHFLASSFFSFQTARASLPPGSPLGPPLPGPVVSPAASPHHPESAAAASVPQPGRHLSGAWLSLEKAFCMDAPPTPRGAHVRAGARGAPLPRGAMLHISPPRPWLGTRPPGVRRALGAPPLTPLFLRLRGGGDVPPRGAGASAPPGRRSPGAGARRSAECLLLGHREAGQGTGRPARRGAEWLAASPGPHLDRSANEKGP